jgi:hypothetical protein
MRRTPNPAEQQEQRLQLHWQQSQQPQPPPPQQQHQPQSQMAPVGLLPPGSLRGPEPISAWQAPLNGFGDTQMHQIGMAPMTPMHAISPPGPPSGLNPQMQSQVL